MGPREQGHTPVLTTLHCPRSAMLSRPPQIGFGTRICLTSAWVLLLGAPMRTLLVQKEKRWHALETDVTSETPIQLNMDFNTLSFACLASVAAAQVPQFRFSEYGNGDTTCDSANLISPSVSIPGTGDVLFCVQFPTGTSSIQYALLEGSQAGFTVDLFTNNVCNGPAIAS